MSSILSRYTAGAPVFAKKAGSPEPVLFKLSCVITHGTVGMENSCEGPRILYSISFGNSRNKLLVLRLGSMALRSTRTMFSTERLSFSVLGASVQLYSAL